MVRGAGATGGSSDLVIVSFGVFDLVISRMANSTTMLAFNRNTRQATRLVPALHGTTRAVASTISRTTPIPVFFGKNWSTTRAFSSSSTLFLPRDRIRKAKEISEEEVKQFYASKDQSSADQFYYKTNPSEYTSYSHTVFNTPPNENGLITQHDGIYDLLKEPTLVIERQVEFVNLFLGFEQANKYKIMNANGDQVGYMQEKDYGIFKMIGRQFFRLHRPFEIEVFNNYGDKLMEIRRPFSFINSHIKAYLPGYNDRGELEHELLGESVQSWHLWRRRYNLFKLDDETTDEYNQYGAIDAPFLSFDFPVTNDNGEVIGSVDRNWVGLGREFFTDTGVYMIRMDPSSFEGMGNLYPAVAGPLTLDQRAILLGTAVSIDFDYFSRHSRGGGGLFSFTDVE